MSTEPKVSFIVPCYKLAHLLGECVRSILEQTCTDFEILIMDDCSPDDTPEVARSFRDPRVRHIRNAPNLRHLRNYNKGIGLARGEYIWLISADDRLRVPYVLERYVRVMDDNPRVGFAFCPGMGLQDDSRETEIVKWAVLESPDAIWDGRKLLRRLLESNCVLAPSGMVRRGCYETLSTFPLDLPYAGDWYLWCLFALHYDAAYFSEPMVNYREHAQSMTDQLISQDVRLLCKDDLAVRWRIKERIDEAGERALAQHCLHGIVEYYTHSLSSKRWRGARYRMSLEEFTESLNDHVPDVRERQTIRGQVLQRIGRHLHWDPDFKADLELYRLAVAHSPRNLKLWLKYLLLRAGTPGLVAMQAASKVRGATRRRLARGQRA
jgi:glycosyltransferase involved in cell wall biosynthesis